jgi:hypothetical protein
MILKTSEFVFKIIFYFSEGRSHLATDATSVAQRNECTDSLASLPERSYAEFPRIFSTNKQGG